MAIMISEEIADYLQSKGIGTVGTDLFVDHMPDAPDTCIAVFSTGGLEPDGKYGYDDPTIEIMTRSLNVKTAFDKIASAYNQLQALTNVTLASGTRVINSYALQSNPANIGQDEKLRTRFTQNYHLHVRNTTLHRD